MEFRVVCYAILGLMFLGYASADCRLGRDHTLCLYKGKGRTCNPLYTSGLSSADKSTIANLHNQLRSKVATGKETRGAPGPQPTASDMKQMYYDEDLAKAAQMWALQCTFAHDKNRRTGTFQYVGQNVAIFTQSQKNTSPNWKWAINSWFDEVRMFNKNIVRKYQADSRTGHYTQIVHAASYKIGCGYVAYYGQGFGYPYKQIYVCNYGPSGNWINGQMYSIGSPASKCSRRSSQFSGLCA